MSSTTKLTLSVDAPTRSMLGHVENQSAYVRQIVLDRWRLWHEALAYLLSTSLLTPRLILDACRQLSGVDAASSLDDKAPALEAILGYPVNRDTARALLYVAAEYWAGNRIVKQAIERAATPPPPNLRPVRVTRKP